MKISTELDVVGIGNAIVDVILNVSDDVVASHGLHKGSMNLIDAQRAELLHSELGPGQEFSGGSVANAVAIAASLGSRVAYVGKVRDDAMGELFARDLRSAGVLFESVPSTESAATARSLIMVTPDGQRTMNTYLGACTELGPADVDPELLSRATVVYLEGYLWDSPPAAAACHAAIDAVHGSGGRVALTLADTFCVERHHDEFRELVARDVEILFANEHELLALYGVESLSDALPRAIEDCAVVAVTLGPRGSVVAADGVVHEVPAVPVEKVVDSTGAGDAYAAGFLDGLTSGRPVEQCAQSGSAVAAKIISDVGARLPAG